MKFRFSIIAIIAFTLGVHNTASADFGTFQGLKFGGGFLWNDEVQSGLDATGGGFHASAEFALLNRVAFSPFYELSRRNDLNSSLFGGEFHYLIPMGGSHAYVGPGFGVADYDGHPDHVDCLQPGKRVRHTMNSGDGFVGSQEMVEPDDALRRERA